MSRQLLCSVRVLTVLSIFVLSIFSAASLCTAAEKQDAAKDDLQQLEGTWLPVSSEMNGHKGLFKDSPAGAPRITIVFKNRKGAYVIPVVGGQRKASELPVVVDATRSPKTLDVQTTMRMRGGRKTFPLLRGIYEVQGDTLRICYSNPMASPGVSTGTLPRPQEIKAGAKTVVLTFQRQKR